MKISKKSIKACEDTDIILDNSINPYEDACEHILSAIDCLGAIAENDDKAKDSIANLSVILFDLK